MKGILSIAINTFREAVRNKILYGIILFVILLVALASFFGSVSIGDQNRVVKDFGIMALSLAGAIATILTGVSLLNKEVKQKTIYNILSKPIGRTQFLIGKFIGLSTTVSLLVSFMGLLLVGLVYLYEKQIDLLLFQVIGFILLEVLILSAVTIFFSSLVITTSLAGIFTFAFYIAGRSISYMQFFVADVLGEQSPLAHLFNIAGWILPDLRLFSIGDQIVYGIPASVDQLSVVLIYTASYVSIAMILASFVFARRELT